MVNKSQFCPNWHTIHVCMSYLANHTCFLLIIFIDNCKSYLSDHNKVHPDNMT